MSGYMQTKCVDVLNENGTEPIDDDGGSDRNAITSTYTNDQCQKWIWKMIIGIIYAHLGAFYGLYLITSARIYTLIFSAIFGYASGLGATAGAHRLWSHRAYKATLPLQSLLMVLHTITLQFSIIRWCLNHRMHHKYSDTDADPHNSLRGFFFCHIGWLLCTEHPEFTAKVDKIDMSDLEKDPLLSFQYNYYEILTLIFCVTLPTLIPVFLWDETIENAWFIAVMLRWLVTFHITLSVNSFGHMNGKHPYDRFIKPTENRLVSTLTLGEGWHNYHHAFPSDYKASELGRRANFTLFFIDLMAKIGWAYDLKSVTHQMIKRRVERTGDGSHYKWGYEKIQLAVKDDSTN